MQDLLRFRTYIIIITVLFFAVVGYFVYALITVHDRDDLDEADHGVNEEGLAVFSITPQEGNTLQSGTTQSFEVQFNTQFSHDDIEVQLYRQNIFNNTSPQSVAYTAEPSSDQTLHIMLQDEVVSNSEYHLSLIYLPTNETIFSNSYRSTPRSYEVVPENNEALIPHLPHETTTFRLSYLPDRNVYVFNFKYNPDIPGTIAEQYENARLEAEGFIRSNGVDPDSLVIEWRHS